MDKKNEIIRGFNSGYKLMNLNPELGFELASSIRPTNDGFTKGFLSGVIEFVKEKSLSKEKLKKLIEHSKTNKGKTISKER